MRGTGEELAKKASGDKDPELTSCDLELQAALASSRKTSPTFVFGETAGNQTVDALQYSHRRTFYWGVTVSSPSD